MCVCVCHYNTTTTTGQWISPTTITGDRPITAISGFSLHLLPHSGNSAIMFGGWTVPEEGKRAQYSNDTYKLTMTNNTVVSSVLDYYCM